MLARKTISGDWSRASADLGLLRNSPAKLKKELMVLMSLLNLSPKIRPEIEIEKSH